MAMETCEFKFKFIKHIYTSFAFNTLLPVILHNVCVCYENSYRLVRWTTLQRSVGINFCGFFSFEDVVTTVKLLSSRCESNKGGWN